MNVWLVHGKRHVRSYNEKQRKVDNFVMKTYYCFNIMYPVIYILRFIYYRISE